MAELRVKGTGTIKLFESDNTSSVTIASPASLSSDRTVTLPDADVTLVSGTMSTVALTGSTDNQVTTVTAANAISGEANLTFDGTDLTVATGNVIMGTSGKGIDFAATSGTGDSELFDDYERGTWTPTMTGSTSGSGSFGAGYYTKVGNICNVSIAANNVATPTLVGDVRISLPFTADAAGQWLGNDMYYYPNSSFTTGTDFVGIVPSITAGVAYMVFQVVEVDGDRQGNFGSSVASISAATVYLRGSVTYMTA